MPAFLAYPLSAADPRPLSIPARLRDLGTGRTVASGETVLWLGPPEPATYCSISLLGRDPGDFGLAIRRSRSAAAFKYRLHGGWEPLTGRWLSGI
jgi:hypothetical protein